MKGRLDLILGDITEQNLEAIVNAANTSLLGGGGVDGAIHRAAGPELIEECKSLGGCPTGEARITRGYNLPAQWVIHTVGPVWRGGGSDEAVMLARCYESCFDLVNEYRIQTIAFPSISTGAYAFPVDQAARIALSAIQDRLAENPLPELVRVVCFDQVTLDHYRTALSQE